MKLKNLWMGLGICLVALGCKQDNIMLFDLENTGIYFQQGWQTGLIDNAERYQDSTTFSFTEASLAAMDTTLTVRIRSMGKVKDYPRPVKVTFDPGRSTAIEGVHFDIDHGSAVIPTGKSETHIGVRFHRTPTMLDEEFVLVLKLEDNEHFNVYIKEQKNTNVYNRVGSMIGADQFKFMVSEFYTKPLLWEFLGDEYFGQWSREKIRYMISVTGWSAEQWHTAGTPDSPVQYGRFGVIALTVRNALQALADAGTPMREANGSLMQLGPNYRVNY